MITTYTKEDFNSLDFETKCVIMENILTDEYFNGQTEIDFYCAIDEKTGNLLQKPPEIAKRDEEAFSQLIVRLTNKLFEKDTTIDLDIDKFFED